MLVSINNFQENKNKAEDTGTESKDSKDFSIRTINSYTRWNRTKY